MRPTSASIVRGAAGADPLDLERRFGITGGNIFHGEMSLDQMFVMRPWRVGALPDAGRGAYLCGSGAHPGGGVMGAPGIQRRPRNAGRSLMLPLVSGSLY